MIYRYTLKAAALLLCFLASRPLVADQSFNRPPLNSLVAEAEQRTRTLPGQIADYTCTLVKRERLNGQLQQFEYSELKLRNRQVRNGRVVVPFSVYLKFLAPADVQGREVIFVEGQNGGKMIARRGGLRFAHMTAALNPFGALALERSRYPITQIGISNLINEMLVVAREEVNNPPEELQFQQVDGVKINGRDCRMLQFVHPVRRDCYRYNLARVFVDSELNLPIRYAAYDWPEEDGGRPRLTEEYTYLNVKLNVGLTDKDFDYRNKSYAFNENFELDTDLAEVRLAKRP